MENPREQFKALLRDLFQFDNADLDFGIYRILNYKRSVVEKFIEMDLIKSISSSLETGALAGQAQMTRQLEELAAQVRENLGEEALDGDGNLAPRHHETKLGKKYLDAWTKARGASDRSALESAVFNHLYTFFSRYYDAGDFMSKRRYSRKEKYAIPYNGEEVYLHWANHDQYYIKTTENFTDYRFVSGGLSVHFKLRAADVEKDSVKGDRRFFVPVVKQAIFDTALKAVTIPFEFRPLTEQENLRYGQKNQQDAIIDAALHAIPKHFGKDAEVLSSLMAERRRTTNGESVSYLEHHFRQYTRRNTSDFFIHKDLRGFLERELDFYLKNEVLLLDELGAADESRAEAWFQLAHAIRSIGQRIITFLVQVEEFQKRLFEKRKFVLETHYCVTLGNLPEGLFADVAVNEAQWAEWKELFHIDEEQRDLFTVAKTKTERRLAFLKSHPTLVVDTRHFDADFIDELLAGSDDLEQQIDGLLIHGENFQALNLLTGHFGNKVHCIYIDPPYNTGPTEILYKNDYKDSSWLSLMENRFTAARRLMSPSAVMTVAIDDYELAHLCELTDRLFRDFERNMVIVNHHPQGAGGANISRTHEYALFLVPRDEEILKGNLKEEDVEHRHFMRSGTGENNFRYGRPNSFFAVLVDPATFEIKGLEKPPALGQTYPKGKTKEGWLRIYPLGREGRPDRERERVWRLSFEGAEKALAQGGLMCTENGTIKKVIDRSGSRAPLFSNWTDKKYNAGTFGTNLVADIIGKPGAFSYPKSLYTVLDSIEAATHSNKLALVLDYFAGSGTTGHAVISLNRQDDGERRFVLVELDDYFHDILLPRIKKIIYSPEWKDGKPRRMATTEEAERSPRIVKYIRLESYEDALNNIAFKESAGQKELQFEDYVLSYMLDWETRDSETFLNIEKLATPFHYSLRVLENGQWIEKPVDLPETFNYLLGLQVQTRRVCKDEDRRYLIYRGVVDQRRVVVIWRETKGWEKADFERDKRFVVSGAFAEGADEIFVNGDSVIPGARSLDPLFKSMLFAPCQPAIGTQG